MNIQATAREVQPLSHTVTALDAVSCRAGRGLELQSLLPASWNPLRIFENCFKA